MTWHPAAPESYEKFTEDPSFAYFAVSNLWILLAAALVFIMHLGFATLETGLVVHTHSGEADFASYGDNVAMYVAEVPFWCHRALWQLLFYPSCQSNLDAGS